MIVFKSIVFFLLTTVSISSFADLVQRDLWITDGFVNTIDANNTTIYIGGEFSYVGPNTGGGVILDRNNPATAITYPYIEGNVFAAIPDQNGGWYIGGNFHLIDNLPQKNIAHINADGSVDRNWLPSVNGPIKSLLFNNNTLYIGGHFESVDGQVRHNIASLNINATTETNYVMEWNPKVQDQFATDTYINTMLLIGNVLYVGGHFDSIDDTERRNLAAVLTTNTQQGNYLTPWNPSVTLYRSRESQVNALIQDGNILYAGGHFDAVDNTSRYHLVSLNLDAKNPGEYLTAWDPAVQFGSRVNALAFSSEQLFVGGAISGVDNTSQHHLFSLRTTATNRGEYITDWRPPVVVAQYQDGVKNILLTGDTLYVGGDIRINSSNELQTRLFALNTNAVNNEPYFHPWNPGTNDTVNVFAHADNKLFVGGQFASVGGVNRNNLAALDQQTGEVTEWNPNLNNFVSDVLLNGSTIFVAGTFDSVDNQQQRAFVALNTMAAVTGQYITTPILTIEYNHVYSLLVENNTLYLGGSFRAINNTNRNNIAAINLENNSLLPLNIDVGSPGNINALAMDNQTLYIGGQFWEINGIEHTNIASIDTLANNSMGAVNEWNPNFSGRPHDLLIHNGKLIVSGYSESTDFQSVLGMTILDIDTGPTPVLTNWSAPYNGGTVRTVEILDNIIFAGGNFHYVDNTPQSFIAALDLNNSTNGNYLFDWNPMLKGDTLNLLYPAVFALKQHNQVLYVGGFFKSANGKPTGNLIAYNITLPLEKNNGVTEPPVVNDPPVENPGTPNDGNNTESTSNGNRSNGGGAMFLPFLLVLIYALYLRRKKYSLNTSKNNRHLLVSGLPFPFLKIVCGKWEV